MSKRLLRKGRAVARVVLAAWHILSGVWEVWRDFGALNEAERLDRAHRWARRFFERLQIELEVEGLPNSSQTLWVANHISWLDILVLLAASPCRLVSKSDVRAWPLIGGLAHAAGTVFIERRQRRDAMRVVHDMAAALKAGQVLAVFPEGTTSNGLGLLPFHANLLQAAIAADVPVQAVAITYWDLDCNTRSQAPAYVDDATLLASVWRTVQQPRLGVKVAFLTPETSQGRERRAWSRDLHQRLENRLFA
jgi:1-acyl-sn-glycerol-3-phosphate acyltransferase